MDATLCKCAAHQARSIPLESFGRLILSLTDERSDRVAADWRLDWPKIVTISLYLEVQRSLL